MSDVAQEMPASDVSGGPPTARAAGALAGADAGALDAPAQLRDAMHDVAIVRSDSARKPYVMIYLCEDANKAELDGLFMGTTCVGKLYAQWDLRNFCQANRNALAKYFKDKGPLVQKKFEQGGNFKSYDLSGRLPEIMRRMLFEIALDAKKVTDSFIKRNIQGVNCYCQPTHDAEYHFYVYDDDWSKETMTDTVKYLFRKVLYPADQEESEDDSDLDPITKAELAYQKEHYPVLFLPQRSWEWSQSYYAPSQKKQRGEE
jgi:hypothetical protein